MGAKSRTSAAVEIYCFSGEGAEFLGDAAYSFLKRGAADPEFAAKRKEYLSSVPLTVVVVIPEDPRQREWDEDFAAASALVQNFQLAAWERGVGTIWKTDPYIYAPEFRSKIGVKPGEKVIAMIHRRLSGDYSRQPSTQGSRSATYSCRQLSGEWSCGINT